MFKKARDGKFNFQDVRALNHKFEIEILILNTLDTVVGVQNNKTCHLINHLQIKRFVYTSNSDIIIFLVDHSQTKKDDVDLIQYELLF